MRRCFFIILTHKPLDAFLYKSGSQLRPLQAVSMSVDDFSYCQLGISTRIYVGRGKRYF